MKKIIIVMIFIAINSFAIETQALIKAHKEALIIYKEDRNTYKAIDLLRKAGISNILNKQPKGISKGKYVQLLNDYGFFLQQSADFESNVTTPLSQYYYFEEGSITGDERYLPYALMKNPLKRTKNLCEATKNLEKVIELSPNRSVAYLNLADAYWLMYIYGEKLQNIEMATKFHNQNISDKSGCDKNKYGANYFSVSSRSIRKSYLAYEKYYELIKKNKKEKLIPKRVKDMLDRPKKYIVIQDSIPLLSSNTVCKDLDLALSKIDYRPNSFVSMNRMYKNIKQYENMFERVDLKILPKHVYDKYKRLYGTWKKDKNGKKYYDKSDIQDFTDRDVLVLKYKENIYIINRNTRSDLYFWNKNYKDSDEYKNHIKFKLDNQETKIDWYEYKLKCAVSTINPTKKQNWESEK